MADGGTHGTASILYTTAKTVAAVGGLSLMAATWISSGFDQAKLARLSERATVPDPTTTGSLAGAAAGTRLDPCAMPRRS